MKTDDNIPARGIFGTTEPVTGEQIEEKVQAMRSQMTLAEKIDQMSGDLPMFPGDQLTTQRLKTRALMSSF